MDAGCRQTGVSEMDGQKLQLKMKWKSDEVARIRVVRIVGIRYLLKYVVRILQNVRWDNIHYTHISLAALPQC